MARFAGSVVLVTGAGSGIGAATARRFASEGASVVIADINQGRACDQAAVIEAEGGTALAWQLDVADPQSWAHLSTALRERFGRVDVVHNNTYANRPRQRRPAFRNLVGPSDRRQPLQRLPLGAGPDRPDDR